MALVLLPGHLVVRPSTITTLVTLNLLLQVFDGVATYLGWERFGEGNPLLRHGFETVGVGPTLVVAKVSAVALLLWLAQVPRRTFVGLALAFTLGAYTAFSFVPWSLRLIAVQTNIAIAEMDTASGIEGDAPPSPARLANPSPAN